MAKRLTEIEEDIQSSVLPFIEYIRGNIDEAIFDKIYDLTELTQVYIFSGIIRNFFLHENEIRDIDIILKDSIDIEDYFKGYEIRRNSYGGYKIKINGLSIDIWNFERTWALKHQTTLNFDLEKYIPQTAFFNFSAVMFSLNNKKFLSTKYFRRFLRDKTIDVVYKPNGNNELCVINSLYYSDKYKLKLSDGLKEHIKYLDRLKKNDYSNVQMKHFGKVLYSNLEISTRLNSL